MTEYEYLIDALKKARRCLNTASTMLGTLDKQHALESFEVGYEQAWMEVASLLIAMQEGRLEKYVKLKPEEQR